MEKSDDSSRFPAYARMMQSYFRTHPGKQEQDERRKYRSWDESTSSPPDIKVASPPESKAS